MIISLLRKQRFASVLVILLITLQISACDTKDNITSVTTNINPDLSTNTGTDTNTNRTTADINLSRAAPAERKGNSSLSLSEIAGYQIFYGKAQGQFPDSITINDSSAVGYSFADFPAGTYYFVVTTLGTEGT